MKPLARMALLMAVMLAWLPVKGWADATVEVSPRKVTVGDPVEVVINTGVPPGASVVWPSAEDFAPAELIKRDTLEFRTDRQSLKFTISLFQIGKVELPRLKLLFNNSSGADTTWVEPGSIEVTSVLDPRDTTADIRDIKPPVRLAWTFRDIMPYIMVVVILVILGVVGYILWRRWRKAKGLEPEFKLPPPPPEVTAMRKLEELRIKKLWQSGFIKEYHSELSEIIKEYIGGRYQINALEMTTSDLLDLRSQWPVEDEPYRWVRRILITADLVKFARFKPDPHENDKCLESAFTVVEQTKPKPAQVGQPVGVEE
jgi:hypothetical protein